MRLYFVKAETAIECVFGGHWLADSAHHARNLALIAYNEGLATAAKHGLPQGPPLDQVTFTAKPSKADPAAMAINYPR